MSDNYLDEIGAIPPWKREQDFHGKFEVEARCFASSLCNRLVEVEAPQQLKDLEAIARENHIVAHCLTYYHKGYLSYEQALVLMVQQLVASNQELSKNLYIVSNTLFSPTLVKRNSGNSSD